MFISYKIAPDGSFFVVVDMLISSLSLFHDTTETEMLGKRDSSHPENPLVRIAISGYM